MVVPSKGGGNYAVLSMVRWLKFLGWDKVVVEVDKENSMNKLYDNVQEHMGSAMELRKSPRYSSQSLADGDVVNGLIAGKIRTWMIELADKYKEKMQCGHYIFPWIVRHSSWTLACFYVNKSGTTAHRVIHGHDYLGELNPLGETVMAKLPRAKSNAAARRVKGIDAGKSNDSDEHIVMTAGGAQTYRTVRRLPPGSQ